MTNPIFNPQPNYSGVTIQIANPAVNVSPNPNGYNTCAGLNSGQIYALESQYNAQNRLPANGYITNPQNGNSFINGYPAQNSALNGGVYAASPQAWYGNGQPQALSNQEGQLVNSDGMPINPENGEFANQFTDGFNSPQNSYPAQYYLNNYGVVNGGNAGENRQGQNISDAETRSQISDNSAQNTNAERINNANTNKKIKNVISSQDDVNNIESDNSIPQNITKSDNTELKNSQDNLDIYEEDSENRPSAGKMNSYKQYAKSDSKPDNDMTTSENIIEDLNEREAKIAEEKKNTKETKIVGLTDEYIKSLENYLNNPNDEIRIMASKEVLTRLDEDKDRYNDAALNALLNKMMQDPSKLVRIAALSAFASQLASGNDYTVQLLHNIQSNPNSDKEDVLQAADILLKMAGGVEVKNIPNPAAKENNTQQQ